MVTFEYDKNYLIPLEISSNDTLFDWILNEKYYLHNTIY